MSDAARSVAPPAGRMALTGLLGHSMVAREDGVQLGTIIDALIDASTGDIIALKVSPGGRHAPAIVGRDNLEIDHEQVLCDLSPDDFLQQRADDETAAAPGPFDIAALPPVLVGPFGNTVAPAMGAAVINALTGRERTDRTEGDDLGADWYWFEMLQGKPVIDGADEVGALDDFEIDPRMLTCITVSVRSPDGKIRSRSFRGLEKTTQDGDRTMLSFPDPSPDARATPS